MITVRTSQLPQFYTHRIGSLPRPPVVRDLLAKRREMSADTFARTLDDLVIFAFRLQEQAGLDVVSDGEWRRSQYIREFLDRVGGFERCRRYSHQGETKFTEVVVRRMTAAAISMLFESLPQTLCGLDKPPQLFRRPRRSSVVRRHVGVGNT